VRLLPLLLVVALLVGCDTGGGDEPEPKSGPPPAITRAELGDHLAALQRIADRNGGNRSAGTPGYDASADYVAARLEDAGWHVTRQPVPFTYFRLRDASLTIDRRELTRADDFQVLSYSGSGEATGRLNRSNAGCEPGDFDDLQPGEIPLVSRSVCFFRDKARNAERAGAEAVVIFEPVSSRRGVPSGTLVVPGVRIPVVLVSLRALRGSGPGSTVRVSVRASSRRARTENVIAETPGGNANAVVMAGGHLDSVAGGPGINDNGSAAATLIEAAEAIGPKPPGARVRLAFWGAEELGLVGSRRYVDSLDRDERRRIRAYLNFDMVGSPNAVPEVYGDGDAELERVLRRAAAPATLGAAAVGGASDHAPFQDAGIPVNGLYTGASEPGPGGRPRDPCYHLACDTQRRVNRPVLLRMARAAAEALRVLSARHK
jgi:peptidase M28-like protein/PA domain-containing protein